MGFEYEWGHGNQLPAGYTVVGKFDFPIYDGNYFIWVHLSVRVFWFIRMTRKVAVHCY